MRAWRRPQEDGDVPLQAGMAAAERDLAVPAPLRHAHDRRLVPGVGRLQASQPPPVSLFSQTASTGNLVVC